MNKLITLINSQYDIDYFMNFIDKPITYNKG